LDTNNVLEIKDGTARARRKNGLNKVRRLNEQQAGNRQNTHSNTGGRQCPEDETVYTARKRLYL
jgi:hypothetical protein